MRVVDSHYSLRVNGSEHAVTDALPGDSLLNVLRDRVGLTGTKGACEEGECGSCSVLVDGVLVCSCLTPAAAVVGSEIVTIEGLGATQLSDVQAAFVEAGAVQCGFCTPGLIVATHHLLDRLANPSESQIRESLSGNICRCTGYGRIIEAVQRVVVRRGTT